MHSGREGRTIHDASGWAFSTVRVSTLRIARIYATPTVLSLARHEWPERRDDPQWIVAARPLYHLQLPFRIQVVCKVLHPLWSEHGCVFGYASGGARTRPYAESSTTEGKAASLLAWILT